MQLPQLPTSTHQVVAHHDLLGGMNYSSRPHRLAPNQWRMLMNMCTERESLSQVPLKKVLYYAQAPNTARPRLLVLASLSSGLSDFGTLVGLTETEVLRMTGATSVALLENGVALTLNTATAYRRWGTCVYNNRLFFVNELNEVKYTDGVRVYPLSELPKCYDVMTSSTQTSAGPPPVVVVVGPFSDSTGGALGSSFTWTAPTISGFTIYRIHCTNPERFKVGQKVRIRTLNTTGTTVILDGAIYGVHTADHYIRVNATNIVDVPNVLNDRTTGSMLYRRTSVPSGRYVQVFYDHLVVGAPTLDGERNLNSVCWSNLNDFTDFEERTDSEADSYHCVEYQAGDSPISGVTGMQLVKDVCMIYTPMAIYGMRYIGLPRVVNVAPLITDYGCGFRHSLVTLDNVQAFIDYRHKQILAFDGRSLEPIGSPIVNYFFDSIHTDFETQQMLWGYVDHYRSEVVWNYVSSGASGLAFDKAIVFNYSNKTWSVRSVENPHSFCNASRRATVASELLSTCASQTPDTCDEISLNLDTAVGRIWGGKDTLVMREEVSTDTLASLLHADTPYLETGDYFYESLGQEKEVHSILLNATALAYNGVKVEISARKSVDTAVAWADVGTWTSSLETEFLTFVAKNGKVIRFKFTPLATGSTSTTTINAANPIITESRGGSPRGFVLTAIEPHIVSNRATK